MEISRKLNIFGAIIGGIGVFGLIVAIMILMNTVSYMKGIVKYDDVTLPASSALQYGERYYITYSDADSGLQATREVEEDEFTNFDKETADAWTGVIFEDSTGMVYTYEDKSASKMDVVNQVGLPFKLPIIISIVALAMTVGGFLWCFHGKPSQGRDLGEIIQTIHDKEDSEDENSEDENSEDEDSKEKDSDDKKESEADDESEEK